MARWSSRRVVLAIVVVVLMAFLVPPLLTVVLTWTTGDRFRVRIAQSMERALGRKVTVGRVALRLLPRPGFYLYRLAVADDPAFGAEPLLRADEVRATFRLSSLWRRRLELASLSLGSGADINPPSLNLVRAADGRWNVEALLQRASQTPSAPTAQSRPEARPRFPYLEADGGRINFKIGPEKKVYALTEADFALWLASENEWAFRLAARPVRTDFNLSDTGVVKVNGQFRRAPNLRDTPIFMDVTVQNAQLGALTKLIYGRDRGWRGTVAANAHLAGTPAALKVTAQAAIQDFRRYDIKTSDALLLQAQCTGRYSSATEVLSAIDCQMPLGNGRVLARGNVQGLIQPRAYNLNLAAEQVGVQTLVTLARHAKKDLPDDLAATGDLDFGLSLRKDTGPGAQIWSGGGRSSEVVLSSSLLTPGLDLPPLGFALEGPGAERYRQARQRLARPGLKPSSTPAPALRLAFAPFRLPVGATTPANVGAWFGREEYELHVQGDARIPRLLQVGRALGLRVPDYAVEGTARVELRVAGNWAGFTAPQITGHAQLRDVSASVHGLNAALHATSANLQLDPDVATVRDLALHFPGSSLQLAGSIRLPRNCASLELCPFTFDLKTDQISLDDLNRLVNPKLAKRAWYEVFGRRSPGSVLARIRAAGQISARRLVVKSLVAQNVSAFAKLHAGVLTLSDLRAEVLGGRHRGDWRADFTGVQPQYAGAGAFTGVAMPELAELMHDDWAGGMVDANYRVALSGSSAHQLASSVTGAAGFDWRNGVLRHLAFDSHSGPLQFKTFTGEIEVRDGILTLAKSSMATSATIYQVSGTASLERQLGLKLRSPGHAYDVSGSLNKPKVTAVSTETRAALQR